MYKSFCMNYCKFTRERGTVEEVVGWWLPFWNFVYTTADKHHLVEIGTFNFIEFSANYFGNKYIKSVYFGFL